METPLREELRISKSQLRINRWLMYISFSGFALGCLTYFYKPKKKAAIAAPIVHNIFVRRLSDTLLRLRESITINDSGDANKFIKRLQIRLTSQLHKRFRMDFEADSCNVNGINTAFMGINVTPESPYLANIEFAAEADDIPTLNIPTGPYEYKLVAIGIDETDTTVLAQKSTFIDASTAKYIKEGFTDTSKVHRQHSNRSTNEPVLQLF